jgi:hypothetical protein
MRTAIAVIGLIVLLGGCEQQAPYHPQADGGLRAREQACAAATAAAPAGRITSWEEAGRAVAAARACGATEEELRLAGMGIVPPPRAPLYIPPPAPVSRPVLTSCVMLGGGIISCISD